MVKEKTNITNSLSTKVEEALNKQIEMESFSSQYYLALGSWAENKGYLGAAKFLYLHSDEERVHMMKFFKYVNTSGGYAKAPNISNMKYEFKDLKSIFEIVVKQEIIVGNAIKNLYEVAEEEKDFYTTDFLGWFLTEQREELQITRRALQLCNLIESDDSWRIDQEIGKLK